MTNPGLRLAGLALAALLGTAVQLQQPRLWAAVLDQRLLAAAALLLALAWRLRARVPRAAFAAVLVAVALAGAVNASTRARARLAEALPAALERQPLRLTGVVAELPQEGPEGLRFVFEIEQARTAEGAAVTGPRRASLAWSRGGPDEAALSAPGDVPRAGQRWRLWARLQAPHALLNPHGFDGELWLFEQGLRATGSVRAGPEPPRLLAPDAGFPVQRLRQAVRDAIQARVADPRAAGVLAALAVGDQAAIDRADWALFRATGIAHLMAISGLHVTMLGWLAGTAAGALWRRAGQAPLRCPAPTVARWAGVAGAAAYSLLAGFGVPAQRTVWMLATVALLASLGARWPWPLVLLAAAVVVAALDPWALLQAGFWLSFAAVGLLLAAEAVQRPPAPAPAAPGAGVGSRLQGAARELWRTQLIATAGLAPLTLLLFQQLSLVGFAANLVAIPVVTLGITPLALAGVLVPPLWTAAAWGLDALSAGLALLASLPGAVWSAPVAPGWARLAGLLGGLLLVAPLPPRVRALGAVLVLPLALPPPERLPAGAFEVLAADVGQGSAVLVRTRAGALLYDTGPRYGPGRDAGERVLLPLLRALGVRRLDDLVVSHQDLDHAGGAAALLAAVPVGVLRSSLPPGHELLREGGVPHARCEAGQQWERDGVRFAVLHPPAAAYGTPAPPNALSCVLKVTDAAGRSLLLTGDIGAAQEAALLRGAGGPALRAEMLVLPHHGSRTSSSDAFLDAVAPSVAVIQAGHHNRFGHPAPEVLARLAARHVDVVQSPSCGAWRWRDGAGRCERDQQPHYWRAQPQEER